MTAAPDVSALTLLEMLRQLGDDPDALEAALGSVYEQVLPLAPGTFDLWRDGQPYATAQCTDGVCVFHYWDHAARVEAFSVQATFWTETQIGPLQGDWPFRQATGDSWSIDLTRSTSGSEGEFIIKLWRNQP